MKFSTLPVITLCIIIIARFDAILDQSEHVHLYYHPSNCTNGIKSIKIFASSLNKTNRPHVAVALYSYKSQRTSKHAKNTSDTLN